MDGGSEDMGAVDYHDKYRFSDRRVYNYGPPDGSSERRFVHRREEDKFKVWLRSILEWHMEETISDEQVKHLLEPVLARIHADDFH